MSSRDSNRRGRARNALLDVAVFASLLALGSCGGQSSGPDNGGRTHWLRACETDTECGTGLCWQEHCTSRCSMPRDCEALASTAECSSSLPADTAECALEGEDVCLPRCSQDSQCSAFAGVCASGLCVPSGCAPASVPTDDVTEDAGTSVPDASAPEPSATETEPSAEPTSTEGEPQVDAPGIHANVSLDGAPAMDLNFEEEVRAYTRDPANRTLVSVVATRAQWGSLTLSLVNNPGPVAAGEYSCATGASFISATMLTETGILSFTSDSPPTGACSIQVVDAGEQVGAPFSGTFTATLVASAGNVLTITDGAFWGALNE